MQCDALHDMLVYEFETEKICRTALIDYTNKYHSNEEVTFTNTDRGFIGKMDVKQISNYSRQIECIEIPNP